jgi:hypothetical protein
MRILRHMPNAYKHKHPLPPTSNPCLFPNILQIDNILHRCTTQHLHTEKIRYPREARSRSAVCETGRFISTISSTWLCYIHTILPTNPYSATTKSTSLLRILQSVVIFSQSCKLNLTLKQINPLPSHVSSTALLYTHYLPHGSLLCNN